MDGGWSVAVVVGAQDGRGCAGAGVNGACRNCDARGVDRDSWAVERATRTSVYRSCATKNLGFSKGCPIRTIITIHNKKKNIAKR
jgi:hypothetical protein